MSITTKENCYRVALKKGGELCSNDEPPKDAGDEGKQDEGKQKEGEKVMLAFRLVGLTTPETTDGTVDVVVSSQSDAFPPQEVAPIEAKLDSQNPKDIAFDFALPEGTGTCALFELGMSARAGRKKYAGVVSSPCE